MELRQIEAFLAVAEELHFGRAAHRLRMAQSPLSQTIKKLEKSLGTDLFERNTRAVSLTTAGFAFLPHARKILEELDLARRAATADSGDFYGRLSIGFSGALNHRTLPPLTRALRHRYPHLDSDPHGGLLTQDALDQLRNGSLDLVLHRAAGRRAIPGHPAHRRGTAGRHRSSGPPARRPEVDRPDRTGRGRLCHHAGGPGIHPAGGHFSACTAAGFRTAWSRKSPTPTPLCPSWPAVWGSA